MIRNSEVLKKKGIVVPPTRTDGKKVNVMWEFDCEPAITVLGITPRAALPTIIEAVATFADAGHLP